MLINSCRTFVVLIEHFKYVSSHLEDRAFINFHSTTKVVWAPLTLQPQQKVEWCLSERSLVTGKSYCGTRRFNNHLPLNVSETMQLALTFTAQQWSFHILGTRHSDSRKWTTHMFPGYKMTQLSVCFMNCHWLFTGNTASVYCTFAFLAF